MPKFAFLFALFLLPSLLFAQPANDECVNAIVLEDLNSWCSVVAEFSNIDATVSSTPTPPCFDGINDNYDVWFSFVANAPNMSVSIIGATALNTGGTMVYPEGAIYEGSCGSLDLIECQAGFSTNGQVALFTSSLTIGATYYIRVAAQFATAGTFQLCVNNFNDIPDYASDCEPGVVLCDQSSFTVGFVTGAGNNTNEINDVSCSSATCILNETSSTWYKWVCDEAGLLEFTITPLNPSDDFDFVLFELPNGIDDCSGKFDIRCMASGENTGMPIDDWVDCTGATGMSSTDTDIGETCGCQDGNNNFVQAVDMEVGKAYALVIFNFSQSGNGFSLDFSGSIGTFLGPDIAFEYTPQEEVCIGDTVTYTDASTYVGTIESWNWNFGVGAIPATATGPGPHIVTYANSGDKVALLQIETETGCFKSSTQNSITVICCDNTIAVTAEISTVSCLGDSLGNITLTVSPDYEGYLYSWDTGEMTANITGLDAGEYNLTISDGVSCDQMYTFVVENDELYDVEPLTTPISACIGNDGKIELLTNGGIPPFSYDWNDGNGFTNNNTFENLSAGTFTIDVLDALDCPYHLEVTLDTISSFATDYTLPNVFTPNGDDVNDVFKLYIHESITEEVEILVFEVYNRWGEVVFETNSATQGWSGEFKGQAAASDTYLYRLEMRMPCEENTIIKSGEVVLMR